MHYVVGIAFHHEAQMLRVVYRDRGRRTLRAAGCCVLLLLLGVTPTAAATTFVVNSTGDGLGTNVGNGLCETSPGNQICTLRRAIAEADVLMPDEPGPPAADVTIRLKAPGGLITLTAASPRLRVAGRGNLTILGSGRSDSIVEASSTNAFQFLATSVHASGFTVQHAGEAIVGSGVLVLDYVAVTQSQHGIIWDGNVSITGGDIRNNGTPTTPGGGLRVGSTTPAPYAVVVRRTTFHGNLGSLGGALRLATGTLVLDGVTFSNNVATSGGAIALGSWAALRASLSTFVANTAYDSGGAIFFRGRDTVSGTLPFAGTAVLAHTTFNLNQSDYDQNGFGSGAALAVWRDRTTRLSADVSLTHSILMGDEKTAFIGGTFFPTPGECDGPIRATGPNLFGIIDCTVTGTPPMVGDAQFLPLQNNGGPTLTTSPGTLSPSVNAGQPAPCLDAFGEPLSRDQRHHVFPTVNTACDLGAVERESVPQPKGLAYDLDGDAKSELVWRQRINGANAMWKMTGATVTAGAYLTTVPWSGFTIVGSDDFDGDGKSDLLWRDINGRNAVWLMNGSLIREGHFLPSLEDAAPDSWRVAGTGDVDGDRRADIVWERMVTDGNGLHGTGESTVWLMDGGAVRGVRDLPATVGWSPVGVGDANNNQVADLLWREQNGSGVQLWLMAGAAPSSQLLLPIMAAGWSVAGFADLNGDHRADVVWRNLTTGGTAAWLVNGTTSLDGTATLPTVSPSDWTVKRVVDTDGDAFADVFWRASDGRNKRWRMNGLVLQADESLPTVPDTDWEIK